MGLLFLQPRVRICVRLGEPKYLSPNAGSQLVDTIRLALLREISPIFALGLTPRTTHQYVVAILRKWNVKGRLGLRAMWLRRD